MGDPVISAIGSAIGVAIALAIVIFALRGRPMDLDD